MKILTSLILLVILASCSDSNTATTSTSGGGGSAGDFIGTMRLSDYRGRIMADQSGVTVQIEGTSFSAVSDASGNWVIHNLPTGNYAISFSKPNFCTRRNPSYSFVGGSAPARYRDPYSNSGNTILPIDLGELPKFTVTLDAITMPVLITKDTGSKKYSYWVSGRVFAHTSANTPDSTNVGMFLIISKQPDLRIEDTSSYISMTYSNAQNKATTDSTVNLAADLYYPAQQLKGVQPGDVVYFKAYPVINGIYQFNSITNKIEILGNGPTPSNVLSATLQ